MAQTIKLKRSATAGGAPTTSQLELGEVAINTYDGKMYIKKSVAGTESIVEISGGDSGTGIIDEFLYTATAGQTAFSGNDDNSDFLSYVTGAIQVFLNGILLDPETDYTATNGALITLVSAAAVNDYLQIFSFKKKISDGNVTVDSFSGNNSTTAFTLSIDPGDENNTRVFVDGVYQSKANYTVSGTTLTFSTAPPSGTAIEVESGNRSVTLPTTENLDFPDNVKLRLGTSQDLEIYHDGSDSYITDSGTGNLKVQADDLVFKTADGSKEYLKGTASGSVRIRHNNSTKFETTSTGVDVTGNIVVSGTIDGRDVAADGVTADAALPKAGGAMTGAITTNSTFDGRDVATDGAKLDGIESGATADQTQSEINALGITATGLSGTPAISVANITTTGELRGPASLVIDPAAVGDNTGTVVIKGNLQVDGATTTINSTTLTVDDLNLTLASGAANGTAANGAGITVDGASATLTYQSTGDNWAFNKNLDVTGTVQADLLTTDDDVSGLTTLGRYSSGFAYSLLRPSASATGLEIRTNAGNALAHFLNDGTTKLHHNGTAKLATTTTGIDVTGTGTFSSSISAQAISGTSLSIDTLSMNGSSIGASGNLTLDVAGRIILDASTDGDVRLHDDGLFYGQLFQSSNNFYIRSRISDADIIFNGVDDGNYIDALTLDMSAAGAATFSGTISSRDITITGQSSGVEGGQLNLLGVGSIEDIHVDNYNGTFRIFDGSAPQVRLSLDTNGLAVFAGKVTAPQLAITSASTADTVTLTRGTNGQNNMLKFVTGSTNDWIVGERNDSTSDFRFYSYGTSSDVLSISRANGNATFSGSVTAPNLYVADDIGHSGDSDTYISFDNNSQIFYSGGTRSIDLNPGSVVINEGGGDQDFRVESTGSANMLFVNAGADQVGVGCTSINPDVTMQVERSGSNAYIRVVETGNTGIDFGQETNGNGIINLRDSASLRTFIGGSERTTLTSTGNLGIGTSDPKAGFQVMGPATATVPAAGSGVVGGAIFSADLNTYGMHIGSITSGVGYIQQQRTNTATHYGLALQPNGGDLGIGTASPQRNLDVRHGLNIFGSGGYTELMLRGRAGTAQNLGAWHWSIRGDVGGANDDLMLLRFTGGNSPSYAGTSMHIRNDNGYVGIGTNTGQPSAHLHVKDATGEAKVLIQAGSNTSSAVLQFGDSVDTSRGGIEYTSTDDMAFSTNNMTEAMRIRYTGNVGIGTASPTAPLSIRKIHATGYGSGIDMLDFKAYYPPNYDTETSKASIFVGTSDKHTLNTHGGYLAFRVNQSGFAGSGATNLAEAMRIEKDGNVGIGTASPTEKLHIHAGGIYTTPVTYAGNQDHWALKIGASNNAGWDFAGIKLRVNSGGGPRMSFMGVSQVEAVSIVGGNVGMGTISPAHKLDVLTSTDQQIPLRIKNSDSDSSTYMRFEDNGGQYWDAGINYANNDYYLSYGGTLKAHFTNAGGLNINGTGNSILTLNIGTTAGNYSALNVGRTDGGGTAQITPAVTGGVPISGIPGILLGSTNTALPAVAIQTPNSGSGHIVFNPKGTEKVRITADGNVGIGIQSPFSRLQSGGHTFSGGHGMYTNGRVGISNHGSLTGMMLASTYNDAAHPEYGLVFVQGPSTSSYNVWSVSPDGPAKGDSLNFHYQAQSTNIHAPANAKVSFDGNGNIAFGGDLHFKTAQNGSFIGSLNTSDLRLAADGNHIFQTYLGGWGTRMEIRDNGIRFPAGNYGVHTTQEHYTASTPAPSFSTASNITYNSSTQYWPDQGEKQICVINARAYTKYIHIKTNLAANNIMFMFRTKGYFYATGVEEQLIGGYTYNNNSVISKSNETVAGNTHTGDTYRATDGSLVLKMHVNQTGYTEGKMLVFFHAHSPSTTSGITVTAVTQKDDGTNAF